MSHTITDAVALAVTVVTLNSADCLGLLLLFRAGAAAMTELVAVAALHDATVDDLTSIRKTLHVLLGILGPGLTLARTSRLRAEAIRDGILLVHVALEIHIGKSGSHVRLLNGDEEDTKVLAAEGLLELDVGGVGAGFHVDLDAIFDVVKLTGLGGVHDDSPSIFSGHVREMAAVDLACRLTNRSTVSCSYELTSRGFN